MESRESPATTADNALVAPAPTEGAPGEAEAPPLRVPRGARFDCHGCGDCCRNFQLGPVEPAIIAGLHAANPRSWGAPWAEMPDHAPLWREIDGPNGPATFLARRDGACVFLEVGTDGGSSRCAIHARLGASAKPAFCREFPVSLALDPVGLVAIAREECSALARSAEDGSPLEPEARRVARLPRSRPIPRFAPAAVAVLPGVGVSLDDWMALEAKLLDTLEKMDGTPTELVGEVRGTVEGALRRERRNPDRNQAIRAKLGVLSLEAMALRAGMGAEASPTEKAHAERLMAGLESAHLGWRRELETGARPPTLGRSARNFANLTLRGWILGKRFAAWGGLGAGLGLWLHNWEAAIWASALAGGEAAGTDDPIEGVRVQPALARQSRLTGNGGISAALSGARAALWEIFLQAG
jgi:Fe-S-cluster containining protein